MLSSVKYSLFNIFILSRTFEHESLLFFINYQQTYNLKEPRPDKKKFALADREAKERINKTDDQVRTADKTCRVAQNLSSDS